MEQIVIGSEGEMEWGLTHTIELAKVKGDNKKIQINFSSEAMMDIFMNNLMKSFYIEGISSETGLDLTLVIPEE